MVSWFGKSDQFARAIKLFNTNNSQVYNMTLSNSQHGIDLNKSHSNMISNITTSSNSM